MIHCSALGRPVLVPETKSSAVTDSKLRCQKRSIELLTSYRNSSHQTSCSLLFLTAEYTLRCQHHHMAVRVKGNSHEMRVLSNSPLFLLLSKVQDAGDAPECRRWLLLYIQRRRDPVKGDSGSLVATGLELCKQSD